MSNQYIVLEGESKLVCGRARATSPENAVRAVELEMCGHQADWYEPLEGELPTDEAHFIVIDADGVEAHSDFEELFAMPHLAVLAPVHEWGWPHLAA